jgi:uncharacterized membrane protein
VVKDSHDMLSSLHRLWRHFWHDDRAARHLLDDAALDRLQQSVQDSERRHTGEIRVCIEGGLPLHLAWRGQTARERALELFGALRVWDTEHDNGVLVYLLLAEHAIEIVADRGLSRHVSAGQWEQLAAAMSDDFHAHRFEAGLKKAIAAVDGLLVSHFPLAEGAARANELDDRPFRA